MASVRSGVWDEQWVANGSSERQRTVDLALISLVADLAHKQRNPFLPIHSNIHGIVVVAEKTRECRVCRA